MSVAERVRVPHSRPFVGDAEAEAAAAVVRSRALAAGAVAAEVEATWRAWTGTAAAACVASGVGALRLGLWALGVGRGDEVIVPAYSCVALLNAALALGATPVLADVACDDWTLDPEDAAARVTGRTRAAIAVDLFGMPARLDALRGLGVPLLEDCAHGIGGRTAAGPFGGGGDVSIGSFYATKMIAGGEGGILAAHDPALVERARGARDYGDQPPAAHKLNDKLTDVEAAIVREQLRRLPDMLARRAARAARYADALAPLADAGLVVLPPDVPGRIWYRYALRLTAGDALEVCERMAARGVRAEAPVWDLRGAGQWRPGLDVTATAFDRVVSLPLYPDLTEAEQALVADSLREVLAGVSGDTAHIAAYYDHLVDRYGHDPRAVDASSRASLDVRYRVLGDVGDMAGKRVLEVGCGFGDLGAALRERYAGVTYRGVDLAPRMVQEGRRAHPELDLEVADVLDLPAEEAYDFVVAQGIFYLLRNEPEARMRALVERMFALAREAVAFTAISGWAAERDADEFHVDPAQALALGGSLTKAVVLRHDYHPGDLAVYLYKRSWR